MKPGDRDDFILKAIQPFPDGNIYMVLEDVNGLRLIQDYKPYVAYGLKPGAKISCKVDKINCNGKIFLEPQHPWFEEGQNYELPIASSIKFQYFTALAVRDPGDNPYILFTTTPLTDSSLLCSIFSIRKGQVVMEPADRKLRTPLPNMDGVVEAVYEGASDSFLGPDGLVVLSLGNMPLMVKKRCLPSDCKVGGKIPCLIRPGSRMAEPVNPKMLPGHSLKLIYQTSETRPDLLRGPKTFILAEDKLKNQYEILVAAVKAAHFKTGDTLVATVRTYKCGRPVIELAETLNS